MVATQAPGPGYAGRLLALLADWSGALVRAPLHGRRADVRREWARRSLSLSALAAVVIIAMMLVLDAAEINMMPTRGTPSLWPLRIITDFGKSSYVLTALTTLLALVALIAAGAGRFARGVLGQIAERLAYVLGSVALAVIVGELMKGIIGRGRPFVGGKADAFHFSPLSWSELYASFPSGHALTSCALAFSVAALYPRLRWLMATYALVIVLSRLFLLAHHPSDVVGGMLVGVTCAMAVRYFFAVRGLAFRIAPDGTVNPAPGPSFRRLKRVARAAFVP